MTEALILFLGFFLTIWLFIKSKYSYWKNRGVPYIEPKIPYGNLKGVGKTTSMKEFVRNIFSKYKDTGPFVGSYFFCEPVAIILDFDLVKNVLIKDFSVFQDRKVYYDGKREPLSAHMFNLDGEKWHLARQKLSPTFTSGRMKHMFPMIVEISERFIDLLNPIVGHSAIVEIRDLLLRYTIDVSGTIIYGIECNSMKDPKTEFCLKGKRVFNIPRHGELVRLFMDTYPRVARFFRMKQFPDDVSEFFMNIISKTIEYREENNIHRNDLMDLLIQLKNTGNLEGEHRELGKLTNEEIAAQAFIFFVGGFEVTASTIGFALYLLCQNQEIQEKVRQEIEKVLKENDGNFSYNSMMDMKYLHCIVDETLRMYPQIAYLFRKVISDYPVPGTKHILEKGTSVMIPVLGINYNPDLFPNPEEFNPDNFLPERVAERNSVSNLVFGDGPRNCIGKRLAKVMIYVGLVTLLRNYRFKPSEKTPIPLEFELDVLILKAKTDFYLLMEKL